MDKGGDKRLLGNNDEAPAELVKRTITATLRALAGRDDIFVNYAAGAPALRGNQVRLPTPARKMQAEDLARLPASRLNSASCSRSSLEAIKATPRLNWFTISKIASSRFASGVCTASSRPILRWTSARRSSGMNE